MNKADNIIAGIENWDMLCIVWNQRKNGTGSASPPGSFDWLWRPHPHAMLLQPLLQSSIKTRNRPQLIPFESHPTSFSHFG
jgi:hypothetical protein